MRRRFFDLICMALACAGLLADEEKPPPPSDEEVVQAVRLLGSDQFKDRETASQKIRDWGVKEPERVLAFFPKDDPDPVVRSRLEALRETLERELKFREPLRIAGEDKELREAVPVLFEQPNAGLIEKLGMGASGSRVDRVARIFLLAGLTRHPDAGIRLRTANMLGILARRGKGDRGLLRPALEEMLKDPDPPVRSCAAGGLGNIGDAASVPVLIGLLEDADLAVRQASILALGHFKDPAIVKRIVPFLGDEEERLRGAAAIALGYLGEKSAAGKIEAMLKDKSDYVRYGAANALGKIGAASARTSLEACLQDPSPKVRCRALESLFLLEAPPAVSRLKELLKDPDESVRISALCGLMKEKGAVSDIVPLLEDRSTSVRRTAAGVLSKMGAREAAPAVARLLEDSDAGVRCYAAGFFGQVSGQEFPWNEEGVEAARAWWDKHKDDPEFQPKK